MWNLTKKITETARTFKFSDFPLILCGNGPKGTKTMQTQTLFSRIRKIFRGIQGMPSESWRPGLSENVVVFVGIIFWAGVKRVWNFSNVSKNKKPFGKRHGYKFAFKVLPLNQPLNIPIGPTLIQYGSLKRKIVSVSFFCTVSLDNFFSLKFDPTSTSHNSG